jgi:hypothetical protein
MELKEWQMEYKQSNRKGAQSKTQRNAKATLRNLVINLAKLCGKFYQLKKIGIEA